MISTDRIITPGGVKSIQTGYVDSGTSTSTGEDVRYVDVTISAVVIAKSLVLFQGGAGVNAAGARLKASDGGGSTRECTARLTTTTNLRISSNQTDAVINGRWQVIEFE